MNLPERPEGPQADAAPSMVMQAMMPRTVSAGIC